MKHAERAHALLSASKAEQWLACTPSARLQESIPDVRNKYAEEGTLAHELAEIKLRRRLLPCGPTKKKHLDDCLKHIETIKYHSAEMEEATQRYVEFVEERFMEAKARSEDAVILLEEQLDFSEWVPDGYGTGDVVIISDGVLEVIDLKYGKGVPVSAEGNPQIRLYGLGAWNAYSYLYDISEVRMTIVQPRMDSISTDCLPIEDLLEWADTVVKPASALADAGEGEFKPGNHCHWCKVKATCRARADANMESLKYEFQDPDLLSNEEIGSILFIAEKLQAWAKDVQEFAYEQALKGEKIPQWKLVSGRSNRIISDKDKARTKLESSGLEPDKYLKPQDLLGISELEKRIGKKELNAIIGGLIIKPEGKPVLVPETDKRPELNSIDADFGGDDFDD